MTDIFSRLVDMDCAIYQFDVGEMVAPDSLWELPVGWRSVAALRRELPEVIKLLSNTAIIFASDVMVDSFAPTAVASGFQIEGNVDLDGLFIGLGDKIPDEAVNQHTHSRVVARESEYLCAQVISQFTAACNEEIVDFESITVFDFYVNPDGLDVLLQRTVITPRNSKISLPTFNDARPQQQ